MKLSRKMKFCLIEIILAILGVLFLLLGGPKLPGIGDFFHKEVFGIISVVLFLIFVVLLLIVYVAANYLDIHFLKPKESSKAKEEEKQGASKEETE